MAPWIAAVVVQCPTFALSSWCDSHVGESRTHCWSDSQSFQCRILYTSLLQMKRLVKLTAVRHVSAFKAAGVLCWTVLVWRTSLWGLGCCCNARSDGQFYRSRCCGRGTEDHDSDDDHDPCDVPHTHELLIVIDMLRQYATTQNDDVLQSLWACKCHLTPMSMTNMIQMKVTDKFGHR